MASFLVGGAAGRLVVFESKLEHEVLPCYAPRYALTIWFTRKAAATPSAAYEAGALGLSSLSKIDSNMAGNILQLLPIDESQQVPDSTVDIVETANTALQQASQKLQQGQKPGPSGEPHLAPDTQQEGSSACQAPQQHCCVPQDPSLDMSCITRPGHIFISIASYRDSETQVDFVWTASFASMRHHSVACGLCPAMESTVQMYMRIL